MVKNALVNFHWNIQLIGVEFRLRFRDDPEPARDADELAFRVDAGLLIFEDVLRVTMFPSMP